MIFAHTWEKVLSGQKTQTRRLIKPKEILSKYMTDANLYWMPCVLHRVAGNAKWYAQHTYAVQSGRGKSALWWKEFDGKIFSNEGVEYRPTDTLDGYDYDEMIRIDNRATWKKHGYIEARIRITDIRREDVRCISDEDVWAEGFINRGAFFDVWLAMHDAPAAEIYSSHAIIPDARNYLWTRPAEKYQAWVLTFELVRS